MHRAYLARMVTYDVVLSVRERLSVALRPLAVSFAILQVTQSTHLMLWTYTMASQGRGQRLSSAWRGMVLQLHLSETWPCSLEGSVQVRYYCAQIMYGTYGCMAACVDCLRALHVSQISITVECARQSNQLTLLHFS